MIWVQPAPWYIGASLYDNYLCLVAFEQAANSTNKNSETNIETIDIRQYTESRRHNQTFDLQPKTCCFGIDIRLLFLVSIARTIGMNMSVERQRIAN